jgi:hypothetical protein
MLPAKIMLARTQMAAAGFVWTGFQAISTGARTVGAGVFKVRTDAKMVWARAKMILTDNKIARADALMRRARAQTSLADGRSSDLARFLRKTRFLWVGMRIGKGQIHARARIERCPSNPLFHSTKRTQWRDMIQATCTTRECGTMSLIRPPKGDI